VSTAEPWHIWILYPELANHVDYLSVHMLPYWEGIEVEAAVEYVVDKMKLLEQTFPGKEILIGEVGCGTHAPVGSRIDVERGAVPAALSPSRAAGGLHLLRDGSLRPAVERALRGEGRARCATVTAAS
jgi:hypothetical protein